VSAQIGTKAEVKQEMKRVADWQVQNFNGSKYGELNWVYAPFYLGLTRWAEIAEREDHDKSYYDWLMKLGRRNGWQLDKRMYHADDIAVSQAWLQLYEKYKQKAMVNPTVARADWVVANPPTGSFDLDYGKASTLEHWTWCDALFMAPPVYLKLYNITGQKKFIRFMDKEYKATYKHLYDEQDSLFFRDSRYFTKKEANGAKVFWGRGNGWVVGGLAELLRELPAKSKYRKFYQDLFVRMCARVAKLQNPDGFWHASLLDPASYPSPETSSSAFFVYALAYGVNEGLLSREEFMPVIAKGWEALVSSVDADGKLGYVQPIGADPKKVTRDMTEVYGPGAFLLAGAEIYRLVK
jgi:rhamnogalacturonyl hydrolase YesR